MPNFLFRKTLAVTAMTNLLAFTPTFADEISIEICPPDPCTLSVLAKTANVLRPELSKPSRIVSDNIRERVITPLQPQSTATAKNLEETAEPIEVTNLPWGEASEENLSASASPANNHAMFANKAALSNDALGEMRGTFTQFTAESLGVAVLEANAINNVTNGGVTGDNVATNGALSGAQGVVSFVQNSGNNTIIQSATVINLYFDDAASGAP